MDAYSIQVNILNMYSVTIWSTVVVGGGGRVGEYSDDPRGVYGFSTVFVLSRRRFCVLTCLGFWIYEGGS